VWRLNKDIIAVKGNMKKERDSDNIKSMSLMSLMLVRCGRGTYPISG